jgi:hypothetical protein
VYWTLINKHRFIEACGKHLVKTLAGKRKSHKRKILWLEVVMVGKLDPHSKKPWAMNMKLQVHIFKHNAYLANVIEDFGSLVITLSSQTARKQPV